MNTHTTTRILALAVLLVLFVAGAPLWAQKGGWPSWKGGSKADVKEYDEMGRWYTDTENYLVDAYNLQNDRYFAMYGEIDKGVIQTMQAKDRELFDITEQVFKFTRGKQKDGVKFWKKNKASYQAALTAQRQRLAERKAAEQAKKAEAERKRQRQPKPPKKKQRWKKPKRNGGP
jgi:hypothetical protein